MDAYADFEEFVRARWLPLLRTATLLTGDRHAAEDLVQDTLARAAQRWSIISSATSPDAYVRRILYTRSVDSWRWRRRQAVPAVPHDRMGATQDEADHSDSRIALADALRRLTPKQRAVLVVRFYEDRTERDAARILGCSVNTVKTQTRHALARLRQLAPRARRDVRQAGDTTMMTSFQQELTALAEAADGGGTPAATPLKAGVRRRRCAAVRSLIAVCVALAGLAFVAWPGLRATPPPPASTAPPWGETPRAYPSVIAESHFPPSALSAHRPMAAVYLAGQALFAVDDHGQTWKAPKAGGERAYAALSPDGRYATDGWAVYDFLAGTSTRLTSFSSLPREYLRIGAGWSPDAGHYAVIADAGTQAKVAVGTPSGEFVQTPLLPPSGDTSGMTFGGCFAGSACPSVRVGWLDNTRLLLLVPAAPTPEDATRGSSLQAFTWAVGERDWQPEGALQLPPKSGITYGDGYAFDISSDGRTVALSVDIQDGGRGGTAVVTWPLPTSPSQSATGAEAFPRSNFIDGITWRARDLVVSRNGVTTVARTSEVLSESGSGSGRPISWRPGAFDGVPYYNAVAVWRDRLFVWAVLLGSLAVIVVGIRVARPVARRAGLLSDRYASPFPIEARWIYSR